MIEGTEALSILKDAFMSEFNKSEKIQKLYARVRDGTASYADANSFAIEVGKCFSSAMDNTMLGGEYAESELMQYMNNILYDRIGHNYSLIEKYCEDVQNSMLSAEGLGLKSKVAIMDSVGVNSVIDNLLVGNPDYISIADKLKSTASSLGMTAVDDVIAANAEFHHNLGLKTKLIRTYEGAHVSHPERKNGGYRIDCKWCKEKAGTWDWDGVKDHGLGVFARHDGCLCQITYKVSKK